MPARTPTLTRRAVLATTSATLVACSTGGPTRGATGDAAPPAQIKKGAVVQWAIDSGATRTLLRDEQLKLFGTQYPDITVERLAGANNPEKTQALFAAGTPPDFFELTPGGLAFYGAKSQLAPLDPLMRRDKYDLSDFFPNTWEMWRFKNRYYGYPFIGIRIGYFNRTLAQQTGARVPTSWKDPAWTFDAFREAAQKATSSAGATPRWGADMAAANVRRDWQPWVWNNGGNLFNEDGTKLEFDQPPAVEAIEFLVDLMHRHRVAPTPQQLTDAGGRNPIFRGGNLLAYHAPTNNVAQNRQATTFDWSLFGLPRGKGKQVWASGGGTGWFMPATTKVKDETWELIKFLAGKESVRIEALRGEVPPSRRSIAADPAWVNPPEAPKADMKVVAEALEVMHIEPPLLNGVDVDRILTEELIPVWLGEKPVREAIASAAAKVKPLLNTAS